MHLQNPTVLDHVRLTKFSAVGDGVHIELADPSSADPLLTFRMDERLGLQAVLHFDGKDIAFSVAELKRAIDMAELEVHGEDFYDQ